VTGGRRHRKMARDSREGGSTLNRSAPAAVESVDGTGKWNLGGQGSNGYFRARLPGSRCLETVNEMERTEKNRDIYVATRSRSRGQPFYLSCFTKWWLQVVGCACGDEALRAGEAARHHHHCSCSGATQPS
jgi:hypothetical protein